MPTAEDLNHAWNRCRFDCSTFHPLSTVVHEPCCLCLAFRQQKQLYIAHAIVKTTTLNGSWSDRYLCRSCYLLICDRIGQDPDFKQEPRVKGEEKKPVRQGTCRSLVMELIAMADGGTIDSLKEEAMRQDIELPPNFDIVVRQLANEGRLARSRCTRTRRVVYSPTPEGLQFIEFKLLTKTEQVRRLVDLSGGGLNLKELTDRFGAEFEEVKSTVFDCTRSASLIAVKNQGTYRFYTKEQWQALLTPDEQKIEQALFVLRAKRQPFTVAAVADFAGLPESMITNNPLLRSRVQQVVDWAYRRELRALKQENKRYAS